MRNRTSVPDIVVPVRVESELVLDDLADGIQCQSPVGLSGPRQGAVFRIKHIRQFICGPTIGEGSYGKVVLALDGKDGSLAAVKIVRKNNNHKKKMGNTKSQDPIAREVELQQIGGGGDNILGIKSFFDDELKQKAYLVFPYAMGTLEVLIANAAVKGTPLPDSLIFRLSKELVNGVEHLHSNLLAHRDIKPSNCMIASNGTLLISDFGTAELLKEDGLTASGDSTPLYAPPEIARGSLEFNGFAADVWSAGVTIYYCKSLALPFQPGSTLFQTYESIVHGAIDYSDIGVHEKYVSRMLDKDETTRATASEMLNLYSEIEIETTDENVNALGVLRDYSDDLLFAFKNALSSCSEVIKNDRAVKHFMADSSLILSFHNRPASVSSASLAPSSPLISPRTPPPATRRLPEHPATPTEEFDTTLPPSVIPVDDPPQKKKNPRKIFGNRKCAVM
eukprot:TRINITY_DN563_c6_g1_i1.p1 TRINITY_DN563_c6_g1~~TRINITY_DN563_c6_g1_i1.p1  ORF type:complete len:450 (+),score=59.82 TRINITY_DN563_c6_g1_i1:145-1494(+)